MIASTLQAHPKPCFMKYQSWSASQGRGVQTNVRVLPLLRGARVGALASTCSLRTCFSPARGPLMSVGSPARCFLSAPRLPGHGSVCSGCAHGRRRIRGGDGTPLLTTGRVCLPVFLRLQQGAQPPHPDPWELWGSAFGLKPSRAMLR